MADPKQSVPDGLLSALPDARKLLETQAALEALLRSPDVRTLAAALEGQSADSLRQAADAAGQGDSAPLQALVGALLNKPKEAQALRRLQQDFSGR